jgi:predicted ABC-type ATPase
MMNSSQEKKIIIIAGPNGAGKTTFAKEFLPQEAACFVFVNADLIAAGLSPFAPEQASFRAGRLMLEEIDNHARRGVSFAFETTLSGRAYVGHISDWKVRGYIIKLFFIKLLSPELAIARVRRRVEQGGHGIAEMTIRRRFVSGWRNFDNLYKAVVHEWELYDNSGGQPVLIDKGVNR